MKSKVFALSFLLVSLLAAAPSFAAAADQQSGNAIKKARSNCNRAAILPPFAETSVPVSFELPKKSREKVQRPFDFAKDGKRPTSCTGDECGCDVELVACEADCNGDQDCVRVCRREYFHCTIICCSGAP